MAAPSIEEMFKTAIRLPSADLPSEPSTSHQPDEVKGVGEISDVADPPAKARLADSETSLVFSPDVLAPQPLVDSLVVMFPVQIQAHAGGDGGADSTATWTYTIADLLGEVLGTGLAPCGGVRAKGLTKFAPNGSYGIAFLDTDNTTIILHSVCEVADTQACP